MGQVKTLLDHFCFLGTFFGGAVGHKFWKKWEEKVIITFRSEITTAKAKKYEGVPRTDVVVSHGGFI